MIFIGTVGGAVGWHSCFRKFETGPPPKKKRKKSVKLLHKKVL